MRGMADVHANARAQRGIHMGCRRSSEMQCRHTLRCPGDSGNGYLGRVTSAAAGGPMPLPTKTLLGLYVRYLLPQIATLRFQKSYFRLPEMESFPPTNQEMPLFQSLVRF